MRRIDTDTRECACYEREKISETQRQERFFQIYTHTLDSVLFLETEKEKYKLISAVCAILDKATKTCCVIASVISMSSINIDTVRVPLSRQSSTSKMILC